MSLRSKIFIVVVLATHLVAPSAFATDLLQVYEWARANDLEYQASVSKFKSEILAEEMANTLSYPQIQFTYRWLQNDYQSSQESIYYTGEGNINDIQECGSSTEEDFAPCVLRVLGGFEYAAREDRFQSRESNLTLVQTLFNTTHNAERAKGKAQTLLATAEMEQAEKELILRVVEAYLGALKALDNKNFARQQLESIQAQQVLATKRYRLGVGHETEVFDAQAAYDAQATTYELSKAEHYLSLRRLSIITGVEMTQIAPVSPNIPVEMPYPADANYWVNLAMDNNSTVEAAEAAESISMFEMRKHRSARMPTVNFAVSYSDKDITGGVGALPGATSTTYGVEVRLPIYQGGSISVAQRQSAFRYEEAQQKRNNQRKLVETNIINTLLLIQTDIKRYKARQRSVESARKALEATHAGYLDGASTLQDLFQSQKGYYQALKDVSAARYDYILNVIKLKLWAGTLNITDIKEFNAWFQAL